MTPSDGGNPRGISSTNASLKARSTKKNTKNAAALLMVTAWPLWIAFGREHFAYPYGAFAAVLNGRSAEPLVILAHQRKFAANIAISRSGAMPSISGRISAQVESVLPSSTTMISWAEDDRACGMTARISLINCARLVCSLCAGIKIERSGIKFRLSRVNV